MDDTSRGSILDRLFDCGIFVSFNIEQLVHNPVESCQLHANITYHIIIVQCVHTYNI